MQTTMKKRLFTLAAAMVMLFAMAMPAFAAESSTRSANGYSFSSYGNTYYQLNAASSSTPVAGTLVTMWQNTGSDTQRWDNVPCPGTSYWWFENAANKNVVLSYNGYAQARLSAKNTSNYGINTQGIKMVNEGVDSNGYVRYGLVLPVYVVCATATGYSNGSQVQWLGSNGLSNQLWIIGKYN